MPDWEGLLKEVKDITEDPNIKTTAELAKMWDMSPRQAEKYLEELEKKGLVIKTVKVFADVTGRTQRGAGWKINDGPESKTDPEVPSQVAE